jgi:hypothetical protein
MELFGTKIKQILSKKFMCEKCNYNTDRKSNFDNHLHSSKHTMELTGTIFKQGLSNNENICDNCNKIYKTSSGLWKHKQKCINIIKEIDEEENIILKDDSTDKHFDLIMMLIKQNAEIIKENSEFKNMVIDVIKNGTTNTSISHNNSHNKAFNLNFFLNETCKNAMNITEFADSIKLQLSDFENVGDVGFITGISNIIIKKLKALDVTQRPVHCTDQKREIIYIKDEDKWEKEDDKKQKFHKFLKKIINKNQRLILKFQEVYPDYNKYSSPNSTRYDKIVIEALGGRGDNNLEKEDKILSIISKTIGIEK